MKRILPFLAAAIVFFGCCPVAFAGNVFRPKLVPVPPEDQVQQIFIMLPGGDIFEINLDGRIVYMPAQTNANWKHGLPVQVVTSKENMIDFAQAFEALSSDIKAYAQSCHQLSIIFATRNQITHYALANTKYMVELIKYFNGLKERKLERQSVPNLCQIHEPGN